MAGFVIDIFVGFVVRWLIILWRKKVSRNWPTLKGTVARCKFEKHGYGGDYVVLEYRYTVESGDFQGVIKKPYLYSNFAEAFVRHYPVDRELRIRVNPAKPTQTFPVLN